MMCANDNISHLMITIKLIKFAWKFKLEQNQFWNILFFESIW